MSRKDGPPAEMRRPFNRFRADPLALDDDSANRLLAGRLDPADAPPGYAEAAAVMAAATAPARPEELDGVELSLDAFRAALATPPSSPRRPHMLVKLLTVKAAAAAFTGALVIGGVAAAATGTLPEPAQRMAHQLVSAAPAPAGEDHPQAGGDAAKGPDATGAAKAGLCTAYMAGKGGTNGGRNGSVAFQALEQAAGGADKVADYCKDVTEHSGQAMGKGQAAASSGRGQSSSRSAAGSPDLSTIDKAGLCKVYLQRHGSPAQGEAASFQALEQAAGGADKVADYCRDVTGSQAQSGGAADDHGEPAGTVGHGGGQG
ncbi:MAG TPA: hypothetical protein VFA46_07625 [Actinomycetes bacterium]|jgi:hypothetical protein|nr:hypothetical protein [Actinomycetes bacterium]